MLKTRHNNRSDTGIKTLSIDYQSWSDPDKSTGDTSVSVSVSRTGSWHVDWQFSAIEDLQALANEAQTLLDEWRNE